MRWCVNATSVVPSLVLLLLIIGVGMVAMNAFVMQVQYIGAAAGEHVLKAVDMAREKLQIYIWKNVTKPHNITMVTILNKGSIEVTVEYVIAVDYSGNILKEHNLQVTIPPSGRLTRQLSNLLNDENYKIYEDVKTRFRTFYFKTTRGNVFGSTYMAPETLYRGEAAFMTVNGTTVTVTRTSLEEFTPIAEVTVTTGLTITQVTGRPYWDAEVYVVIVGNTTDIEKDRWGRVVRPVRAPVFPASEVPLPEWAKPPEGKEGYVPKVVSSNAIYEYMINCGNCNEVKRIVFIGRWVIDVEPRPVWVAEKQYIRVGTLCEEPTYIYRVEWVRPPGCYCSYPNDYKITWGREKFYPMISIPAGEYTIKAPDYIRMDYRGVCEQDAYMILYFNRLYYVVYDAWNMSNVIFTGNSTETKIIVDRPLRIVFFYKYSHSTIRLPPPPPPPPRDELVVVSAPHICISDDFKELGGFKGSIDFDGRTVIVKCDNCQAYIAPGYGELDLDQVTPCPGNVCSNVPEGKIVIIDGDPKR